MTSVASTARAVPRSQPASTSASRTAGLLRRDQLVAELDRASLGKVTIISAPPGSGKTSLLRAWSGQVSEDRRVAFVPVARDQQDAAQFWLAVLDAIRQTGATADSRGQAAPPVVDGDGMVEMVLSELANATGTVVLVIDDLHELNSADALTQLEHVLAVLPKSAACGVVVPPRSADQVAPVQAGRRCGRASGRRSALHRKRDTRNAGGFRDQPVRL